MDASWQVAIHRENPVNYFREKAPHGEPSGSANPVAITRRTDGTFSSPHRTFRQPSGENPIIRKLLTTAALSLALSAPTLLRAQTAVQTPAQTPAVLPSTILPFDQIKSQAELDSTIRALDAALFDVYNRCDLPRFSSLVAEDVEFYHDQGGITLGNAALTESIRNKGTVTDPTNAVIPDVSVKIVNLLTGVTTTSTTNSDGIYDVPSVPTGEYSITFSRPGFRDTVNSHVTVRVDTIAINSQMQIGSATEQVVVTADAPLVQTEDSGQHMDFDTKPPPPSTFRVR